MIDFNIAGFRFRFSWSSGIINAAQHLGPQLKTFEQASDAPPDVQVRIEEAATDDIKALEQLPVICEGRLGEQTLWSLRQYDSGYIIGTYRHFSDSDPHHITLANPDFSRFTIYPVEPIRASSLPESLVSFPLLSLMLYYQTTVHDAIYLHASAVIDKGFARIFTAKSGVGKTTMARNWQQHGYPLINDDRLMLRLTEDGVQVHNTPMIYTTDPVSAPLGSVYLLRQAPHLNIQPLNGVKAVSNVLSNCIIQGFSSQIIEHHVSIISRICSQTHVFEFENKPGPEVIPFVKSHDRAFITS